MNKRWQFVAVVHPEAFVAAAVARIGALGYGFAYAQDRRHGVPGPHLERYGPLGLGMLVTSEPQGWSRLSSPGLMVAFEPQSGAFRIQSKRLEVDATVGPSEAWDAEWPLPNGPHRTRKRMGAPVQGRARLGDVRVDLAGGQALLDWSGSDPPRETCWRWACGVGECQGQAIAWNLRTGFDDPLQKEDAIWVAGKAQAPSAPAAIAPPPKGAPEGSPWAIHAGDLRLSFEREGVHRAKLDWGFLATRYSQPWGRFTGTWRGKPLTGYGVVEDHWARW